MAKPVLKISRLTQLQDARYCAGMGFDVVSFSLERGDMRKLSVSLVWNIVQWVSVPNIALETNAESAEELFDAEKSFAFSYACFPIAEWESAQKTLAQFSEKQLLLRAEADTPAAQLATILATESDSKPLFEIHISSLDQLNAYANVLSQCFVHCADISIAKAIFAGESPLQPYGISLGEEVFTSDGALDYDAVEAIIEP